MNNPNSRETHLQDEQLVQLLDREAPGGLLTEWEDHLSGCLPCMERRDELEHAAVWVRDHVPALDEGVQVNELARARAVNAARSAAARARTPEPRFGWARAAAVVGFIALAGMTVEPVRAWVFSGIGGLLATPEAPAPAIVEVPHTTAGATVSFAPSARIFRVELAHHQQTGLLVLEPVDGLGSTAQVLDGADESLSVLPAALVIDNVEDSRASYTVTVPVGIVRTVQVVAEGRVLLERNVAGAGEPVVVDLATLEAR